MNNPSNDEWAVPFSLNSEKAGWLMDRLRTEIAPQLSGRESIRILDLGCGCGEEAFLLAELFPNAEVVGLDISEANIARGLEELHRRRLEKVSFVCGDYARTEFPGDSFDLIVADSVLHLIPGCRNQVLPKLARELAPRGLLVFSIPGVSLFNSLLWLARSTLKRLRSPITDRLIFQAARLVHGQGTDEAQLHERTHYMYLTPEIWASRHLRSLFCEDLGLIALADQSYPHASVGQFQHRFCVYTKPTVAGPVVSHAA